MVKYVGELYVEYFYNRNDLLYTGFTLLATIP
nr:MAG TPA: hypothetical protein [Bacteriophage sp.]